MVIGSWKKLLIVFNIWLSSETTIDMYLYKKKYAYYYIVYSPVFLQRDSCLFYGLICYILLCKKKYLNKIINKKNTITF